MREGLREGKEGHGVVCVEERVCGVSVDSRGEDVS